MITKDFLAILEQRGFLQNCTNRDGLNQALGSSMTGYVGFDMTADSLHVGHLLGIMMLRWLQQCGHKPIVILGGGTTKVGDPSFRDESRPLLTDEQISKNMQGIRANFNSYLSADTPIYNNDEWLSSLGYLQLLREVGTHFTIARMLGFDSVQQRLEREQSLTFLEFNYMIMQAYDFTELYRRTGCRLQMGGSDQWGNIINGVELGRKQGLPELFGLTCPLLTTSDGKKMGKSAGGAVWLGAHRLSPYDFWQYWRNCADGDIGKLLRLFTEMPLDEISRLEKLQGAEINDAKKILATEVTALCHGRAAAEHAAQTAATTFEQGGLGEDLPRLNATSGTAITDILVQIGFCASKGEAKRKIEEGAVRLNDAVIQSATATISAGHEQKLSLGKKKHGLITSN